MRILLYFSLLLLLDDSKANPLPDCKGVIEAHCKDLKPFNGDAAACVLERYQSLPPKCQANLKESHKKSPCFEDTIKYCKGSDLKHVNIPKCIEANLAKISGACSEWFKKAKAVGTATELKVKAACGPEWSTCENKDFRKQRECMIALSSSGKMSSKCKSVFDQALKRN